MKVLGGKEFYADIIDNIINGGDEDLQSIDSDLYSINSNSESDVESPLVIGAEEYFVNLEDDSSNEETPQDYNSLIVGSEDYSPIVEDYSPIVEEAKDNYPVVGAEDYSPIVEEAKDNYPVVGAEDYSPIVKEAKDYSLKEKVVSLDEDVMDEDFSPLVVSSDNNSLYNKDENNIKTIRELIGGMLI